MKINNIDYLRLSITDKCNLNCTYCSPKDRVAMLSHSDILRHEELARFVSIMTTLGVRKVRITGGEPMIRRNLAFLIGEIKSIPGIEEVSMTTNGVLFADEAKKLKSAGLDRVNISLDTLKSGRYFELTGKDAFNDVWRSVLKAVDLQLEPVKINVVLFQNFNDDEIFDFVDITSRLPITVRFIEYMEFKKNRGNCRPVSNAFVWRKLKERYSSIRPANGPLGNGPAKYFSLKDSKGFIGLISSNTACFCDGCNRLRMSCDGKLYPCLFSTYHLDVRELLRTGYGDDKIKESLLCLLNRKREFTRARCVADELGELGVDLKPNVEMCYIGG